MEDPVHHEELVDMLTGIEAHRVKMKTSIRSVEYATLRISVDTFELLVSISCFSCAWMLELVLVDTLLSRQTLMIVLGFCAMDPGYSGGIDGKEWAGLYSAGGSGFKNVHWYVKGYAGPTNQLLVAMLCFLLW
ncbi:hypothetical protein OIU79_006553 [Salix purpurea]|uniref:Uncharacterized protein n=1 Tax=Salix purpurea TaxID=77065 RepID=A0A9Q0TVV4_SALPP|nr:hypothetical protein OIU79_006553 [Salix purpurea]